MIDVVLDISHHQRIDDLQQVKDDGIIGIIHKATESSSFVDPRFASRRLMIKDLGLLFGSYHFLRRNGVKEAEFYVDTVKPTDDEIIMLDTESQVLSNFENIVESEAFVERIYQLTGRYPLWYIGNYLLNTKPDYTNSILSNCPLFVARYSNRKQPVVPFGFDTWTLWQYTDSGEVNGITTVDRDIFNGDLQGLLKFWNVSPERAKAFEGMNVTVINDPPDNA